jgi:lipopolysaccharide transport system permease protein
MSGWIENRPTRGVWPLVDARMLWRYRELAFVLAIRDVKLRYKQTLLGVGWAVLQPALAAVLFALVFGRLTDVPSDGMPYAVFAYGGLVLWTYVSGAVANGAESLVESREVVTKTYFPRVLAPIAAVLPGLVDLAVVSAVLAVVVILSGTAVGPEVLLTPLVVMGAVLVALGAGVWLSALNALYRDVRYALGFLLQVWLFVSPVIFPSSLVEGGWRWLFSLNPMVGLLDAWRWTALSGPAPVLEDLVSLGAGVTLLVSGLLYFRHAERRLVDSI